MSPSTMFDLTGRVAIVSGAASGMGRAMSIALAEAGADMTLAGRNIAEVLLGRCGEPEECPLLTQSGHSRVNLRLARFYGVRWRYGRQAAASAKLTPLKPLDDS